MLFLGILNLLISLIMLYHLSRYLTVLTNASLVDTARVSLEKMRKWNNSMLFLGILNLLISLIMLSNIVPRC